MIKNLSAGKRERDTHIFMFQINHTCDESKFHINLASTLYSLDGLGDLEQSVALMRDVFRAFCL
jgi:hypothetical protein